MKKVGKVILYSILGVLALAGVLIGVVAYDLAQIGPEPDNYFQMSQMIIVTAGACSSGDYACKENDFVAKAQCFSPLLSKEGRLACFHGVIADANKKFHPEYAASNHTPEQISYWVKKAAGDILIADYNDPKGKSFVTFLPYFTPEGFIRFLSDMDQPSIVDMLKSKQSRVTHVDGGEPTIKKTYVADNIYTWEVEYPATLEFGPPGAGDGHGSATPNPIKTVLSLKIVRSDMNAAGIGIAQLLSHPSNED